MSENEVKTAWNNEWSNNSTIEDSASFIGKRLRRQRLKIAKNMLNQIGKTDGFDLSVIDMGCGGGSTLIAIRESGFKNSIGIDFEEYALKHCQEKGFKIGEDVFLMDAKNTGYQDRYFDIGFEEGLWEHFDEPKPFVVEAARISDKWFLAIQPNHYSFFGRLLHWAWLIFKGGGVKEYSFKIKYFIDIMAENGFKLFNRSETQLHEQAILLFKRVDQ